MPAKAEDFFKELEDTGTTLGLSPLGKALAPSKHKDIFNYLKCCLEVLVHILPLML